MTNPFTDPRTTINSWGHRGLGSTRWNRLYRLRRHVARLGAVVLVAVLLPIGFTVPVNAESPTLKLPWTGTWNVLRGPVGEGHQGNRAWDFQPPGAGSHNDKVLAVAGGTAKLTCTDTTGQASISISTGSGVFKYAHLQASAVAAAGITKDGIAVVQGQVVGRLLPLPSGSSSFGGACGYGVGSHLHLELPRLPILIDGRTFQGTSPGTGALKSTNAERSSVATSTVKAAASPVVTVDKSGRLWMFATKANGDLYYRHTTNGHQGWDSFHKVGASKSWSPNASLRPSPTRPARSGCSQSRRPAACTTATPTTPPGGKLQAGRTRASGLPRRPRR